MEITRILFMCVVFMTTWKETVNQQILGNRLENRSKRYRETDKLKRESQQIILNENEKEVLLKRQMAAANKIPLGASQIRRPIILKNKSPTRQTNPAAKFQQHQGNNEIDNLVNHKPYVLFVKKDDVVDKDNDVKVNNTASKPSDVEIKKVKKETVFGKTINIKPEKEHNEIHEVVDENKPEIPQKDISEANLEEQKKTYKSRKDVEKQSKLTSSLKKLKSKVASDINTQDKIVYPNKDASYGKDPSINLDDTKHESKHKDINETEEDISTGINDIEECSLKKNVPRKPKHLCPNIQPIKNTVEKKMKASKNCNEEVPIKPNKLEKEDLSENDDDEHEEERNCENDGGVVIKNNNYEEVFELTPSSEVNKLNSPFHTYQGNINPLPYNLNFGEVPKVEYSFNNNNNYATKVDDYYNDNQIIPDNNQYCSHAPNEEKVDHTDDGTIVSYNNYYEMPSSNWDDKNYGNLTPRHVNNFWEQSKVENNLYHNKAIEPNNWNQNEAVENHYQKTIEKARDEKDRVWRTWKNTEYHIKSKNAWNQLNDKLYQDLANQNKMNVDKVKLIQRRNAIGSIGSYRNQNNSMYI